MLIPKIFLFLAALSNLTGYTIYFRLILKNQIKPHAITNLVWSILLGLNCLIQIHSGVGLGSLLLATNFLGCFLIFLSCYLKGYINYDKIDWLCFFLAIIAIILWLITKTPIYSIVLSCVIDFLALLPSFRKSFKKPWEDSPLAFFLSGTEYVLSFPSYQVISFITLLYPVWVVFIDYSYAVMMLIRRWRIKALTNN